MMLRSLVMTGIISIANGADDSNVMPKPKDYRFKDWLIKFKIRPEALETNQYELSFDDRYRVDFILFLNGDEHDRRDFPEVGLKIQITTLPASLKEQADKLTLFRYASDAVLRFQKRKRKELNRDTDKGLISQLVNWFTRTDGTTGSDSTNNEDIPSTEMKENVKAEWYRQIMELIKRLLRERKAHDKVYKVRKRIQTEKIQRNKIRELEKINQIRAQELSKKQDLESVQKEPQNDDWAKIEMMLAEARRKRKQNKVEHEQVKQNHVPVYDKQKDAKDLPNADNENVQVKGGMSVAAIATEAEAYDTELDDIGCDECCKDCLECLFCCCSGNGSSTRDTSTGSAGCECGDGSPCLVM